MSFEVICKIYFLLDKIVLKTDQKRKKRKLKTEHKLKNIIIQVIQIKKESNLL